MGGDDRVQISEERLRQLKDLIASGREHLFYTWTEWLEVRGEALKLDHNECWKCRTVYHRYRRAKLVHHVQHLKERPDLALNLWWRGERQLVSLCRDCHEEEHPERFEKRWTERPEPVTVERWD